MTELSKDEAKLIAVLRAIKRLDQPILISFEDTSPALASLEALFDIEKKQNEYSEKEFDAFVLGFVGGLGATRLPELANAEYEERLLEATEKLNYDQDDQERPRFPANAPTPKEEQEQTEFVGGPSSGVAVGQLEGDPRYIHQTGPKKEEK